LQSGAEEGAHLCQMQRHSLQLLLQRRDVRRLLLNHLRLVRQLEARGGDLRSGAARGDNTVVSRREGAWLKGKFKS
jgi:hypothetical protein